MSNIFILAMVLIYAPAAQAGIVFSALQEGTWEVYYQENIKEKPRVVARHIPGDKSTPVLSLDGQKVAFEVQSKGVYVCSLKAAKDCQEIVSEGGSLVRPAWHPNSNVLVVVQYAFDKSHEDSELFITHDLSTTKLYLMQTGIQDYPRFSPDGTTLAYSSGQTISLHQGGVRVIQQLWLMDVRTGRARQLNLGNSQDIHADWSHSGKQIAFSSNRTGQFEIWIVESSGKNLRNITSGDGSKTWPAWSPDGKSILFSQLLDGQQSLWIVEADGSNLRPFLPFGKRSKIETRDGDWL